MPAHSVWPPRIACIRWPTRGSTSLRRCTEQPRPVSSPWEIADQPSLRSARPRTRSQSGSPKTTCPCPRADAYRDRICRRRVRPRTLVDRNVRVPCRPRPIAALHLEQPSCCLQHPASTGAYGSMASPTASRSRTRRRRTARTNSRGWMMSISASPGWRWRANFIISSCSRLAPSRLAAFSFARTSAHLLPPPSSRSAVARSPNCGNRGSWRSPDVSPAGPEESADSPDTPACYMPETWRSRSALLAANVITGCISADLW